MTWDRSRLPAMIAERMSMSAMAAELGVSKDTVKPVVRRLLAQMDRNGTRPICICGKPSYHIGNCAPRCQERLARLDGVSEVRATVLDLLRQGVGYRDIAAMVNRSTITIRTMRAYLDPEDLETRIALDRSRNTKKRLEYVNTDRLKIALLSEDFTGMGVGPVLDKLDTTRDVLIRVALELVRELVLASAPA